MNQNWQFGCGVFFKNLCGIHCDNQFWTTNSNIDYFIILFFDFDVKVVFAISDCSTVMIKENNQTIDACIFQKTCKIKI